MNVHLRTNLDYLYLTSTALGNCRCRQDLPCECGSRYETAHPPQAYQNSHGFITYRTSPYSIIDDYPPYAKRPSRFLLSDFCQFRIVPVPNRRITIGRIMRVIPNGLPCVTISLTGDKQRFVMSYDAIDPGKPVHLVDTMVPPIRNLCAEFSLEPFPMSPFLQGTLRSADNGSLSLIRDYEDLRSPKGPGDLVNIYKIRSCLRPDLVLSFDNRERYLYMREENRSFLGWQLFFISSAGGDSKHLEATTVIGYDE